MIRRKKVLPTHTWQYKLLAIAYSVLLGFVLPFICWGTLATPGHPHRMAHIVFFMPPMLVEMLAQRGEVAESIEPSVEHKKSDHAGHLQKQADGEKSSPTSQPAQPIGRSVPDEVASAMAIITPLFIIQTLLVFFPKHSILRLGHANVAHLFDPRVLTPPPRHLSL